MSTAQDAASAKAKDEIIRELRERAAAAGVTLKETWHHGMILNAEAAAPSGETLIRIQGSFMGGWFSLYATPADPAAFRVMGGTIHGDAQDTDKQADVLNSVERIIRKAAVRAGALPESDLASDADLREFLNTAADVSVRGEAAARWNVSSREGTRLVRAARAIRGEAYDRTAALDLVRLAAAAVHSKDNGLAYLGRVAGRTVNSRDLFPI